MERDPDMTLSGILTGAAGDSPLDYDQENTEPTLHDLMQELIDEVTLGLCFEVHRASKLGTVFLDDTESEARSRFEIKEGSGYDVFGQTPMKKTIECVCPNCQRNLAASRFAPHLEKCMGMGRNSSRLASKRIANTGKKESDNESDDDNDNDWYCNEKKAKKHKRDIRSNNSPRKSKSSRVKNGDIPSVGSVTSEGSGSNIPAYENMALEDRKARLQQTCGVISEHNKKMCTRSHRCPQHSDEQRRAVRLFLLGQQGSSLDADDIHVDIDSYEDGDSQALRDTLQWEAASNPSPADSTSTNNSEACHRGSSSRKKKAKQQSKKKSQNKSSSVTSGTPSSLYEFV